MRKREQVEHSSTCLIIAIRDWEEQIPRVYKVVKRPQEKGSEDIDNEES